MRAFVVTGGVLTALLSGSVASAQVQQLPLTSRSEGQVKSLNRSMLNDQQSRAAAQQNQSELNSLRNEQSRTVAPPIIVSPPIIIGR